MALKRPSMNASKYRDDEIDEAPVAPASPEPVYEDEDEAFEAPAPKVKVRGVKASTDDLWAAAEKLLEESAEEFTQDFKWTEEAQLVKFIGDSPFHVFSQHWVEKSSSKKKSFVCLGDDCPLCDIGEVSRARAGFTVVTIGDEVSEPLALFASPRLIRTLMAKGRDRSGPLSKHYYTVSRTGTGPATVHNVDVIRGRDLADEWDLDPAEVEAALVGIEPLHKSIVTMTSKAELMEIARSAI